MPWAYIAGHRSQAAVDLVVVEFLSAYAKKVMMIAEIAQVATISAKGDTYVSNLITQATEKVGKEGGITVKEGRTIEDKTDHGRHAVRPRVHHWQPLLYHRRQNASGRVWGAPHFVEREGFGLATRSSVVGSSWVHNRFALL